MGKLPYASLEPGSSNPPGLPTLSGTLLNKQSLLPHPSLPRLSPLYLRRRRRPSSDGILELHHLHHDLVGRRAAIIQREAEREQRIRQEELHRFQQQTECGREEVDGG